MPKRAAWVLAAVALALPACAAPVLSRDGQLVFQQRGAHGASVITANGVEFMDKDEIPSPVVRKSVNEPWRPATGFLLPADGVWRKTSTPTPLEGRGLLVLLRPSDVMVPSWGGEILVRLDALAPVKAFPHAAGSVRPEVEVVVVIDGAAPGTGPLVDVAIDDAGQRDHVAVVESQRGRAVMPPVPGSHRTLLHAAVERVLEQNARAAPSSRRDLALALRTARAWLGTPRALGAERHVLVVTDGIGVSQNAARIAAEAAALTKGGDRVLAVAVENGLDPRTLAPFGEDVVVGGTFDSRGDAISREIPPPGEAVLGEVRLEISSVPAPARVIEASGGDASAQLDRDLLWLGDMVAGEARTEVARVALPPWVPGEPLELTVTAHYKDLGSNTMQKSEAVVRLRYSNDVEKIANSRHGDVIAYASALAMVRRLQRSFLGSEIDRLGGIRPIIALQAMSMSRLAVAHKDPALASQAEVLATLLGVVEE